MGDVVELDDMRPTLMIECPGHVIHIMPVMLIENVIAGNEPPSILGDDVLREIVERWWATQ